MKEEENNGYVVFQWKSTGSAGKRVVHVVRGAGGHSEIRVKNYLDGPELVQHFRL
jgi:hypothetical protein